jgi:hypothetical protein
MFGKGIEGGMRLYILLDDAFTFKVIREMSLS